MASNKYNQYKEALCFSPRKSIVCKHAYADCFHLLLKKKLAYEEAVFYALHLPFKLLTLWSWQRTKCMQCWRSFVEAQVEAFCQLVTGNGAVCASTFSWSGCSLAERDAEKSELGSSCYLAVKVKAFKLACLVNVSNTRIAITDWLTLNAVFLENFILMNNLLFSQVRELLMC